MFRFNFRYFVLTLLLLLVEIVIAVCVNDTIIRPYGGDFLVVIWLYCLVRSFWALPVWPTALGVLLFSYLVETSQYFNLADRLGFTGPSIMRVVLGNYFTWTDILSYTLGIIALLIVEAIVRRRRITHIPEGEEPFVQKDSIVRTIWGSADTILFIFAGASAEFALNKSVDWLYFTGRLPADPLGRLFSTVAYARRIVFSSNEKALAAIDSISAIHKGVEASRGATIPDSAYLDVLFLLIDYSIRSFELLHRPLRPDERAEVFNVFQRVGQRMGLKNVPPTYRFYEDQRQAYLQDHLIYSDCSRHLYGRYRVSLGSIRYWLLLQAQVLLVPCRVRELLPLPARALLRPIVFLYKGLRMIRLDRLVKLILLPPRYRKQVFQLDLR